MRPNGGGSATKPDPLSVRVFGCVTPLMARIGRVYAMENLGRGGSGDGGAQRINHFSVADSPTPLAPNAQAAERGKAVEALKLPPLYSHHAKWSGR
jgi:hypothetical protein